MANVVLKLDLASKTEGKLDSWQNNIYNNVSKEPIDKLEKNDGSNMLVVGSKISDKPYNVISQYNGICGGFVNARGVTSRNVELTIIGAKDTLIDNVTIYFDKYANQFATECIIDDKTYYNDDNIWTLKWESPTNQKTITFTKWNKPYYCACITYLGIELDNVELDKHSIKSISNFQQIRPTQPEPFFSIITGNGEFKIKNSEFLDYANDNILESGVIVDIYINNVKYNTTLIENWDSDFIDKTITGYTADINELLDKQFNELFFEPQLLYEVPLYKLLGYILETGNIKYSSFNEVPYKLRQRLSKIYFDLAFLQSSTYREIINKICLIGEMICIVNVKENILEFIDGRPRLKRDGSEYIIDITANAQEKDFTQNVITDNNYTSVQYEYVEQKYNAKTILDSSKISISNTDNYSIQYKENTTINYKNYGKCNLEYNIHCVKYNLVLSNINYDESNLLLLCNYDYGLSENSTYKMQFKVNNQKFNINNLLNDFINQQPYSSIYDIGISQYYTLINRNISYQIKENICTIIIPYSIEIYIKSIDNEKILKELVMQKQSIKFLISFNEISLQTISNTEIIKLDNNNKNGKLLILNQNEFFSDNVYYIQNGNKIPYYDKIIDNIINDYSTKNGIRFASLTIRSGVDFYGRQILIGGALGSKQKYVNWSGIDNDYNRPNTIRIGDIVKILDINGKSKSKYQNGTDRLWKVIGCEFTHEYVPKWKLELMEIW